MITLSVLMIILACLFSFMYKVRNLRLLLWIVTSSFGYKVFLALTHRFIRPLGASSDESRFEAFAWDWAQDGFSMVLSHIDVSSSYMYSWIGSLLYMIFGREPLLMQLFGVIASTATVLYSYKITINLYGDQRTALWVAAVVAFLPSLSILSVLVLRDALVVLFISAFYFHYINWINQGILIEAVKALSWLLVGSLFHSALYMLIGFVILIEGSRVLSSSLLLGRVRIYTGISFFICLTVFLLLLGHMRESSKVQIASSLMSCDEHVVSRLGGENIKTDAYIARYPVPSDGDTISLLLHAPQRLAFFLLTPTPFMYTKVTDLYRIMDTLLVFILIMVAGINFNRILCRQDLFWSVILIAFIGTMFAFGTFDVLTGQRHRLKIIPVFIAIWLPVLLYNFRKLVRIALGEPVYRSRLK